MRSIQSLINLSGRTALITGGAGAIGYSSAQGLAELGADIILADVDHERCRELANSLQNTYGTRAIGIGADLAKETQVLALVDAVAEFSGKLDILIHSAAFVGTTKLEGWVCPFPQQTADVWRKAIEVNLTSFFILTQALQRPMEESGNGTVIALSSIYGLVGPDMNLYAGTAMGNPAAYAASKGGLQQYVTYLSTVMAPKIRVNTISPGGLWRNQPEVFHERYKARTPLARMATEEDIVGAVVFLASDLSQYVTGHNLVVDGGWTAW